MSDSGLNRCRILIVEDEYLLADELAIWLAEAGAVVLGPASSVSRALALLNEEQPPDGAILDLNLGGESAFAVADELVTRGVPVVFTTGYDASTLPERYAGIPRCEKPIDIRHMETALSKAIHA